MSKKDISLFLSCIFSVKGHTTKKTYPCPWVSPRVTIWPSSMAKNSSQRAETVRKYESILFEGCIVKKHVPVKE